MKKTTKRLVIVLMIGIIGHLCHATESVTIEQLKAQIEKQEHTINVAYKNLNNLQKENDTLKKTNQKLQALCKKNKINIRNICEEEEVKDSIPDHFTSLTIGQIAYFGKNQTLVIRKIQDENNALAEFILKFKPYEATGQSSFGTYNKAYMDISAFDQGTSMASATPIKEFIWLKGINTSGIVDGAEIQPYCPFQITSTKTYQKSNGSSNTVFILEPLIFKCKSK